MPLCLCSINANRKNKLHEIHVNKVEGSKWSKFQHFYSHSMIFYRQPHNRPHNFQPSPAKDTLYSCKKLFASKCVIKICWLRFTIARHWRPTSTPYLTGFGFAYSLVVGVTGTLISTHVSSPFVHSAHWIIDRINTLMPRPVCLSWKAHRLSIFPDSSHKITVVLSPWW